MRVSAIYNKTPIPVWLRPAACAPARLLVGAKTASGVFLAVAGVTVLAACDQNHATHEHDQPGHASSEPTQHEHAPHGTAPKPPKGLNPVQHEMQLLHEAMRGAVTAIANGNVKSVAEALHKVHGAKETTEAALRSGTYKPPKNGDAIARFIELDEQFHTRLEHLVEKSNANDVVGTAAALGKALEGCQGCHAEFRF